MGAKGHRSFTWVLSPFWYCVCLFEMVRILSTLPNVFKAITIKGVYGREMFETWYKMAAMLQSGLDVTPIITHRLPIAVPKPSGHHATHGDQIDKSVMMFPLTRTGTTVDVILACVEPGFMDGLQQMRHRNSLYRD